jgi:hypothetical protein
MHKTQNNFARALFLIVSSCHVYGCPSATKMTLPIWDVGVVDQSNPTDPGVNATDSFVTDKNVLDLEETLISDLNGVDFSPGDVLLDVDQDVDLSDAPEDLGAVLDSATEIVTSLDGESLDSSPSDTGASDSGGPSDALAPPEDIADVVSCDPPQCQGAQAPGWTLTDYQENPPMEKSFDSYSGKVTVVMLLAAH